MADEPVVPKEGDPPPAGDPPADPPKEGDPPPAEPGTISLEALPEDLRNRPEAEVKFLLEHMINTLGSRNNEVENLQTQISELRGAVSVQPPAEPDPDDNKPLEELILEDPAKAIDRHLASRGYVSAVGDLSDRVGEAEFSMVAGQVEDFADHEAQIRQLLKDGKLPATRQNIMGAYTMALGTKVLETRARDVRGTSGTIPPSNAPPPDPAVDTPVMSELENEVARAQGMSAEEFTKYRDSVGLDELKLPT
jgi:hypothetical protein